MAFAELASASAHSRSAMNAKAGTSILASADPDSCYAKASQHVLPFSCTNCLRSVAALRGFLQSCAFISGLWDLGRMSGPTNFSAGHITDLGQCTVVSSQCDLTANLHEQVSQCHGAMKALGISLGKDGQLVISDKKTFTEAKD
jgi:hypothetical protein